MKRLQFHTDAWLDADHDDPDEARTFARLRITVDDVNLTRNLNRKSGATSSSINVPLLPLAQYISTNWWRLLNEPFRSGAGDAFRAKHRLDVPMHGFVFPTLGLCSGGDQTILAAWSQAYQPYSPIDFLAQASVAPEILFREEVEDALIDIVQTAIARLNGRSAASSDLAASWDRVRRSIEDEAEYGYCRLAGKLGLDPYDPSIQDLTALTTRVSDTLLQDVSDAVFLEELLPATTWVADNERTWKAAPEIDVAAFGRFPKPELKSAPWEIGCRAASQFRRNTGAERIPPRKHLEQIFGEILVAKSSTFQHAPHGIGALITRKDKTANIATVARTAREQRFKVCTAAYIAWAGLPGEDRAATPAFTGLQQAGRAFAAELLAPRDYLREVSPKHGLVSDDIEDIAGDLICPYETVLWQAYHASIPLRGIDLPAPQFPSIV